MQQFLKNGKTTFNVMSLTGYRALVLLALLYESPKSLTEINESFAKNPHIKESFSQDTLRMYLNSLRAIGCKISRADKLKNNRYSLLESPFDIMFSEKLLNSLKKIINSTYFNLTIDELILIDDLFYKIATYISDTKTREVFIGISKLKGLNKNLIKSLNSYAKKKVQIEFLYKSPNSGLKNVSLVCDKLDLKNKKLYLYGIETISNKYLYYKIENIEKIISINLNKIQKSTITTEVLYEIICNNFNISQIDDNEEICTIEKDKVCIKHFSKNLFDTKQKILSMGNSAKVISPQEFKEEIHKTLCNMKERYTNA